ncbi:MAG: RNA methyltransferase [Gaiellales bacterium]
MISSSGNRRLTLVRRLQARSARDRLGLFACEGEDLVEAGLAAGLEPVEVLVDADRPPAVAGEPVEPKLLAEVCRLAHPPRVVAVFRRGDLPRLDVAAAPPVGLALWRVADPGNVGALLRAADALGPAFLCLSAGCADPTGPKAVRASMGAIFRVPVGSFGDAPGPRVALLPAGGGALWRLELGERVTFVLGAEREGLPADVIAGCELAATIPTGGGADSLNVAMTGSIALYERRRRG